MSDVYLLRAMALYDSLQAADRAFEAALAEALRCAAAKEDAASAVAAVEARLEAQGRLLAHLQAAARDLVRVARRPVSEEDAERLDRERDALRRVVQEVVADAPRRRATLDAAKAALAAI